LINAVSVTKTEVYTILRDVCIVSNINLHLSEMEILAQPLCETVFTPTTFCHRKRLPIRISKPSHKKFHFKKFHFKKCSGVASSQMCRDGIWKSGII
jgi:hypothetical protein